MGWAEVTEMAKVEPTNDKNAKEFLDLLKLRFKEDLVSVILFGSRAEGSFNKYSDFDFLVIIKHLPEIFSRDKLISDLEFGLGKKYGKPISSILMTPEEFEGFVESLNPLFFGMSKGYVVVHDTGLFEKHMEKFKNFLASKTVEIEEGIWRVEA
jgi:predicted nucleotidyltransferase